MERREWLSPRTGVAILVAAEVSSLLARRERRSMRVDRRAMARGGRRLTDIQVD